MQEPAHPGWTGASRLLVALVSAVFLVASIGAAQITEIIDATGDGAGHPLDDSHSIAVDGLGNVYVAGANSDNAFQVSPGGAITEIIDTTGDGAGNLLFFPVSIAVAGSGNVYVAGRDSSNAFRLRADGPPFQLTNAQDLTVGF